MRSGRESCRLHRNLGGGRSENGRDNDMKRHELEDEIRRIVLDSVQVDGLTAEDIPPDAPLFGDGGVGLDSIDALEIGVALKKKYAVDFKTNSSENRERFKTVSSLADFIARSAGIALED